MAVTASGGPRVKNHFEIEIAATPAQVFHWLDDSERVMQWAENVTHNEDLTTTPEKVGSTFRQVYTENGRDMEFEGRCTAFEPDRKLAVFMTSKMFHLDVTYTLDDLGGRTRLTQDSQVHWQGLLKLFGPVMALFMRKSGQETQGARRSRRGRDARRRGLTAATRFTARAGTQRTATHRDHRRVTRPRASAPTTPGS
jgi:uncharacterized protein YndB with AHSA1/START domain